MIKHFRRL